MVRGNFFLPFKRSLCIRPNQLAWVLTMRKGQSVTFTGTFYRYDDFKKMAWLENCKQVNKK